MNYKSNYYKLHEIKDAIEMSIKAIEQACNQHNECYELASSSETRYINEDYLKMLKNTVDSLQTKLETNKKQLQIVNELLELEDNEVVNEAITKLLFVVGMAALDEENTIEA